MKMIEKPCGRTAKFDEGDSNTKIGNKYLSWAFVEAANFAIRYEPLIARFYQKKKAKTHAVVAIKAVAHKLSRACYYCHARPSGV